MDAILPLRQRKTHQMTLRLNAQQVQALDRINRLRYHGARSRTSLIEEGIWRVIDYYEKEITELEK